MKRLLLGHLLYSLYLQQCLQRLPPESLTPYKPTVDGPAVQSTRLGSSYSVSGSNISVTTLGGLTGGTATAAQTISAGDYDINTDGQAFTFSETSMIGDTPVTSQTCCSSGQISAPNLYSDSITSTGGTAEPWRYSDCNRCSNRNRRWKLVQQ